MKKGGDHVALTQFMHLCLFLANLAYAFYELQYSYIHLYFAMIYITDLVGIWGVYLIVKGNGGEVKGADFFLYVFVTLVLTVVVGCAIFWPEHGL